MFPNGPFGNMFPYTNFHGMNLDWVIQIAKDFLDQYTNIQNTIDQGLEDLDDKATEIQGLLDAWYTEHSEDIASQLANALLDLNTWYETHQGYLDTYLTESIAALQAAAAAAIETIPEDYTALSYKVSSIPNQQGLILDQNLFNTAITPYSTNDAIVNNNDGTFTVKTTSYGTTQFGVPTMLPKGMYMLFPVDGGVSFIGSSTSTSDAYATNTTDDPLLFILFEDKLCYLGFRTNEAPAEEFTITPYVKKIMPVEQQAISSFDTFTTVENVADTSLLSYSTTPGAVNNGDGSFTFNVGSYGTMFFGYPIVFTPGTYCIPSVNPVHLAIRDLAGEVVFSNTTNYDKYVTISDTMIGYFTARLNNAAESNVTFIPYIKYVSPLYKLNNQISSALGAINAAMEIPETPGGFINTASDTADLDNPSTTASYASTLYYSIVECGEGEPFIVNGGGASAFHAWAFISTDDETIISKSKNSQNVEDTVIIAPPGAKYLVITGRINANKHSYIGNSNVIEVEIPPRYFIDQLFSGWCKKVSDNFEDMGFNTSDTFIWLTDPHFARDNTNNYENGMHSVAMVNYLINHMNISKVFCGGDLISGSMLKYDAVTMIENVRAFMKSIWDKTYMIIGNHEWNNPAGSAEQEVNELDLNTLYALLLKDKEDQYGSISTAADYWIDNPVQKIRYFFINATKTSGILTVSRAWFMSQLLSVPEGYTVVLCSHVGLDTSTDPASIDSTFEPIADAMDAYNAKSTYTYNGVTYNYEDAAGKIAFAITGHTHVDTDVSTSGGIPIIGTTCDRAAYSGSSEAMKEARKLGTNNEQAFDVVQVDTYAKTVKLTRFGGSMLVSPDRTFTWS